MPEDTSSLLLKAIESEDGVGYFYICSKDFSLHLRLINLAKDAAMHDGTGDFNFIPLDAREINYGSKLWTHMTTPPMLSNRKIIVINCADKLKSDARQALDEYLKSPVEEDLLLLLFNTPNTERDEALSHNEHLIVVEDV